MKPWMVICSVTLGALMAMPATASERTNFIGAAGRVEPNYDGSNAYRVKALPAADVSWRFLFARTTRGVGEIGVRTQVLPGLSVGAQVALETGRDSNATDLLARNRFETIDTSGSVGVFAEGQYRTGTGWLLRFRQNLNSDYGAEVDIRASQGVFRNERARAAVFAGAVWATGKAMRSDFGVGSVQATRGELNRYEPGSGFRDVGVGLAGNYALNDRWLLLGIAEGRFLVGKAKDSPLSKLVALAASPWVLLTVFR